MRVSHRWLAVLVGLLVVLAGCGAAPPAQPTGAAETATTANPTDATPTETTPTATTTPALDSVALPPGVREDRTVPEPLLAAHAAALRNASRVVEKVSESRTANGTHTIRIAARFAADGRFSVAALERTRPVAARTTNVSIETYVGEDRIYRKRTAGVATRYRVSPRTRDAVVTERSRAGSVAVVRALLESTTFAPVGVRVENGTTLVVLRATGSGLARGVGVGNASSAEATMLVTERGVVRGVSLAVEGPAEDGGTTAYAFTLRVTGVGETTVAEPGWLDDALAASDESG